MKKINFYSGPAVLPQEVLEQAKEAITDFAGTGIGILEISHRSKEFVKVMEDARALVKEIMQLKDNREVLFLQGGASSQFHMVPMNLLSAGDTASYFDTGQWAYGALEEARNFGQVHVACSSREDKYRHIPSQYDIPERSKYVHITSNNTVYGTQFHWWPQPKCPVVADMSSDIFSRQIDFNRFDLIYAGAQKNMGPAGATLVVVNKEILTADKKLPKMLDYNVHIKKDSMNNTPPVFAVYVSYLTLQWIRKQGLSAIEERNNRKAAKLYAAIDASNLFKGTVAQEDRSLMNVCFNFPSITLPTEGGANSNTLEDKFIAYAAEHGIVGIKGYRTVGGFRASIYNAMPEGGVDTLIQAMEEFERTQA